MKKRIESTVYRIEPLNEGQDLNYQESHHCTGEKAVIKYALTMVDKLKAAMPYGSFSVRCSPAKEGRFMEEKALTVQRDTDGKPYVSRL